MSNQWALTLLVLFFAASAACSKEETEPRPVDSGTPFDGTSDVWDGASSDSGVDAVSDGTDDDAADAGPVVRLDAKSITKFAEPLVIPPAMAPVAKTAERTDYAIAARQFQQQVLPRPLPKTTVWGYGKEGDPLPGAGASSFNYPGFTVEARTNEKVRVRWINGLKAADGKALRHLFTVDPTLHWANPPGPIDSVGAPGAPYAGPVPIVAHVHGAHVPSASDGHPQAWFLPAATDIPSGYATRGTYFASAVTSPAGEAVFDYPNDQPATTLWYHDHALGVTRLNVWAGLAGFYLIRNATEDALGLPGPAPKVGDAAGTRYYELPLAIQDRSFNTDGTFHYPKSRKEFDDYGGPYVPTTDVSPYWNPEVFGDVMLVNGVTWPLLEVEPRLYRLRLLNGCNARTLKLAFDKTGLPFRVIGGDQGLLSGAPRSLDDVLLMPGERADVLVDFSALAVGTEVVLNNLGPDEPFKGAAAAQPAADPTTTGVVMKLKVVAKTTSGTAGAVPATLPTIAPMTTTLPARVLTLNEMMNEVADIPIGAFLGTQAMGSSMFKDAATEKPKVGTTEIWTIVNLTADAHPIHLHLVGFQVLDRRRLNTTAYHEAQEKFLAGTGPEPVLSTFYTGAAVPAHTWESGFKDTVIANPGEALRLIANFDLAGRYVWHCHILEHEDNEMMRPLIVEP